MLVYSIWSNYTCPVILKAVKLNCLKYLQRRLHNDLIENRFFITTPIFYVNAAPHIGHLYTALLADASWRFYKLMGVTSGIFSTGTDEHGLKVKEAAEKCGIATDLFCDNISSHFKTLFKKLYIDFSDYIRTSELRHREAVTYFFNTLLSKKYISKGLYSGWYCIADETFIPESEVIECKTPYGLQYTCVENNQKVVWTSEENYLFDLSKVQSELMAWLKDTCPVNPSIYHNLLNSWVSKELPLLSISRPYSRVPWGIIAPNDPDQTVYVWFDALINYLTVAGYPHALKQWPPDVQVIGKDILRFHSIYWPSMLIAAGLEPPKKLFVHGHWTVNNVKMSKSKGNVLCPNELEKMLGTDGLRYALLRTGSPQADSTWDSNMVVRLINAELANCLGNLLSRCSAVSLNPEFIIPSLSPVFLDNASDGTVDLINYVNSLPKVVADHFKSFNFHFGINAIMTALHKTNSFFQNEKPWELLNSAEQYKLNSILHITLCCLVNCGIMLQPVLPNLSAQLLDSLAIPEYRRLWKNIEPIPSPNFVSRKLKKKITLFERIGKVIII